MFVQLLKVVWHGLRFAVPAVLLFTGLAWLGWSRLAPYDQAERLEQRLTMVEDALKADVLRELISLGQPGYPALLRALGSEKPALRQAARTVCWELLTDPQPLNRLSPAELDRLTIMLRDAIDRLSIEERIAVRGLVDRWLAIESESSSAVESTGIDWQARRDLVTLTARESLLTPAPVASKTVQPQELTAPRVAERLTISNEAPRFLSEEPNTAQPLPLPDELRAQPDVAPRAEPLRQSTDNELPLLVPQSGEQSIDADEKMRADSKQPVATPPALQPARGIKPEQWSITAFLASGALESYHAADTALRERMLDQWQHAPWNPADAELFAIHTQAPINEVTAAIDELPNRQNVAATAWLLAFGKHPHSAARKAAYTWLLTFPDRDVQNELQTAALRDIDPTLRGWLKEQLRIARGGQRAISR